MNIIRQTLNLSSGRYTYYKAFHAMLLVPRKAFLLSFKFFLYLNVNFNIFLL